jgi:hypothetical protein
MFERDEDPVWSKRVKLDLGDLFSESNLSI